jgi:hypothetical protein
MILILYSLYLIDQTEDLGTHIELIYRDGVSNFIYVRCLPPPVPLPLMAALSFFGRTHALY